MAIRWDALLARALARELDERLRGKRVRGVLFDRDRGGVVLYMRDATLVFDRGCGVALLDASSPPPEAVPASGRIRSVVAPPDERRLHVDFRGARGTGTTRTLVVELHPTRWNALLVDPDSQRVLRLSRTSGSGEGSLRTGALYDPPTTTREGAVEALSPSRWLALLAPLPARDREKALLQRVAFTSRINAPSFLGRGVERAGEPDDASEEETEAGTRETLLRGYELWRELRALPPANPHVLRANGVLQPYPYPLPHLAGERCPSLLEAFARVQDEGSEAPGAALVPGSVLETLAKRTRRAERRLDRLRTELSNAPDPEALRSTGSLLLARLALVPRGVRRALLEGFDGQPVAVELDPAIPPTENAARYFDRAARAERARARLPELIGEAENRVRRLRLALDGARRGTTDPAVVRRLSGLQPGSGVARGREKPAPLPYRRFTSSGGIEIRVGRGARDNDALTFKHSSPDDVWLHARHAAGAHVILRWSAEDGPPQRDLREAAVLAAVHSKARTSGSVAVDWTRRKHVRKPRKSPAGSVVPDRVRTVFVAPDPELAARLEQADDPAD